MSAIGAITICAFGATRHELAIITSLDGQTTTTGNLDLAANALAEMARIIPTSLLENALEERKQMESGVQS